MEDPEKHFKTGDANDFFLKSLISWINKKAQAKPKLTFGRFTN